MTVHRKLSWTLGNMLMLLGLYLLLLVGGLLADEQYNVYAASGTTDETVPVVAVERQQLIGEPAPAEVIAASAQAASASPPAASAEPAPSEPSAAGSRLQIPALNRGSEGELTNLLPRTVADNGPSTISRIVIPKIAIDKKVIEVFWKVEQTQGQELAIWEVDKYRVGHHTGTSNPGGGGNIVLAGHSGGRAYPFNDLYYLKPGDPIELYSNGELFEYRVSQHIVVDEVGQPLEKRLENARWIEPTENEVVTMVACWPLTGPDKFKQRVIVRAEPATAAQSGTEQSGWRAR